MALPIQAGSLASVIDLAENPPDQPLHSLPADLQQPLVLYIARTSFPSYSYLFSEHVKVKDMTPELAYAAVNACLMTV